ncbi:MAG: bifunctional hydroxymethylpyrimidine kinase/phosphomethylpyrimidine kinase [Verrucomicrobia bacterium]|nr:bifunctional hydroxymethylpyrimidine kinase/phosphomethylpyrimidine kinase [Verrucomicrobiota bacterium]
MKRQKRPIALTIAGSDSGGGAGIQADLKTFAALRVHGTSVITCLTAQNPERVLGVRATEPDAVRQQLEAVFEALPPRALKTGMLFSAAIIEVIVDFYRRTRRPPMVVDPVMVATSGTRLLEPDAIDVLKKKLLPLAALITPNLPEAEALTGQRIATRADMRQAARQLWEQYQCAVLVKGGHLPDSPEAVDLFLSGRVERFLTAPFVRGVSTHGTGCTYSAAITAALAHGATMLQAVAQGKEFVTQAIAQSERVGDHTVLNWLCQH